jgi:RHS repeat-associated protein
MNGGAVTVIYDGDGNRVAKTVGGVTTRYLVDDQNPTGLPQVVEELVNNVVQRQYTYGLQLISENQFVSNTWTPSFYETDGAGNVRQLTNSTGVVTDTYDYDAFGNKVNSTGTTPNNYLYRGEQYDPDLGMYYLRARYYNPVTGRFLSVDSQAGAGRVALVSEEDSIKFRVPPVPRLWGPGSPLAQYRLDRDFLPAVGWRRHDGPRYGRAVHG